MASHNHTTRRTILGTTLAAGALLATGAQAAEQPDAELLNLAASFMRLQAQIDPLHAYWFGEMRSDEVEAIGAEDIRLTDAQDVFADRMLTIRATTAEGLKAKATVARELYRRYHTDQIAEGCLDEDDAFALNLIGDLIGGAA